MRHGSTRAFPAKWIRLGFLYAFWILYGPYASDDGLARCIRRISDRDVFADHQSLRLELMSQHDRCWVNLSVAAANRLRAMRGLDPIDIPPDDTDKA
jgi:hypothetical protein